MLHIVWYVIIVLCATWMGIISRTYIKDVGGSRNDYILFGCLFTLYTITLGTLPFITR